MSHEEDDFRSEEKNEDACPSEVKPQPRTNASPRIQPEPINSQHASPTWLTSSSKHTKNIYTTAPKLHITAGMPPADRQPAHLEPQPSAPRYSLDNRHTSTHDTSTGQTK